MYFFVSLPLIALVWCCFIAINLVAIDKLDIPETKRKAIFNEVYDGSIRVAWTFWLVNNLVNNLLHYYGI